MFVTLDQPRIVLVCAFAGVVAGFLGELFYFVKLFIKPKVVKGLITVLSLAFSSVVFCGVGFLYNVGNFRFYMAFVFLIFILLYCLSLHKPIAFLLNIVYNKINLMVIRVKENVRRKKEKGVLRRVVGNGNVTSCDSGNTRLSNSGNIRKEKSNKNA